MLQKSPFTDGDGRKNEKDSNDTNILNSISHINRNYMAQAFDDDESSKVFSIKEY